MDRQTTDISYYLKDESKLRALSLNTLDEWILQTPGSFLLQFAKARKYVLEGKEIPKEHLHTVSSLSPDRTRLKEALYRPTQGKKAPRDIPSSPTTTQKTPSNVHEEGSDIIDAKPDLIEKNKHLGISDRTPAKTVDKPTPTPPKKTVNTKKTTTPSSKPKKSTEKNKSRRKPKSQKTPSMPIVEPETFTDWLKSLSPKSKNEGKPKKSSKSTSVSQPKTKKRLAKALKKINQTSLEPVSETYADLLASQGHTKRAAEIYKKLINLHPEKKSIFAQKLKNLKK